MYHKGLINETVVISRKVRWSTWVTIEQGETQQACILEPSKIQFTVGTLGDA